MTRNERLEAVKLMHETMICMNNENAYFTWIWTMPDCPTEEDFEWFADDEYQYNDLYGTFLRLVDRYLKYGLYKPTEEVTEFLISRGYIIPECTVFEDEEA
jgi:hypothetical protein